MKSKHIFFIATSFVLYSSISLATEDTPIFKTGVLAIDDAQKFAQDVQACIKSKNFMQCMITRKDLRRSAECNKNRSEDRIQKIKDAAEKTPGCGKN